MLCELDQHIVSHQPQLGRPRARVSDDGESLILDSKRRRVVGDLISDDLAPLYKELCFRQRRTPAHLVAELVKHATEAVWIAAWLKRIVIVIGNPAFGPAIAEHASQPGKDVFGFITGSSEVMRHLRTPLPSQRQKHDGQSRVEYLLALRR